MLGAGLFYQSLARGSDRLRRAGLVVIGLAVIKVFSLDISGLTGLMRVFSLLLPGLGLAGLAWLNRWASARARQGWPMVWDRCSSKRPRRRHRAAPVGRPVGRHEYFWKDERPVALRSLLTRL